MVNRSAIFVQKIDNICVNIGIKSLVSGYVLWEALCRAELTTTSDRKRSVPTGCYVLLRSWKFVIFSQLTRERRCSYVVPQRLSDAQHGCICQVCCG